MSTGDRPSIRAIAPPKTSPITRVLSLEARDEVAAMPCNHIQPPASSSSMTTIAMTVRLLFDIADTLVPTAERCDSPRVARSPRCARDDKLRPLPRRSRIDPVDRFHGAPQGHGGSGQ